MKKITASPTAQGFTLLELMVVIAIMAIASAGAVLALPDASENILDREAYRLAALFDSARAQSRATGVAIDWHATPTGFEFKGVPQVKNKKTGAYEDIKPFPKVWLNEETKVNIDKPITLGPEPIIAPQNLVLYNGKRSIKLVTDGMRPFTIEAHSNEEKAK